MKKFFAFVLIVVIAVLGYVAYSIFKPTKPIPHNFGTVATTTPNAPLTFDTKIITDQSSEYKYKVSVEYPVFKGGTSTITDTINKIVSVKVNDEIGRFKKNARDQYESLTPTIKDLSENSFIEIKYKVEQSLIEKGVLSVQFPELVYMTAAAHPGNTGFTLNIDITTGKQVLLKDLFIGDYSYEISQAAIEKLLSKLGDESTEEMIRSGAGPKEENFKAFYFTEEGMHISFDDYQVAPYAAGPQEIVIGYDRLQPIIDPKGLLKVFKK